MSTPNASSANTLQNNQAQALEAAMIALEPYYYGTLAGNPKLVNEKFSHGYFKVNIKVKNNLYTFCKVDRGRGCIGDFVP